MNKIYLIASILLLFIANGNSQNKVLYPFSWTYNGNPIVTHMYTADPSARIMPDGRIYVYASTDLWPGERCDKMDQYHVFSTGDLKTWTDHGQILCSDDVEWGREEGGFMWAPDCIYKDGTYYFYFPHPSGSGDDWGQTWKMGVATSKHPDKGFEVQGYIPGTAPLIDPHVFIDDDGQAYFYIGGAQPGHPCHGGKLKENMMEIDGKMKQMEGLDHFHEAPWVFKRNGIYYMIYPDHHREGGVFGNRMHYAVSDHPLGPWNHKGVILDPTGIETSHASVVEFNGQWYLFYHNGALSGKQWLRSICFDKLYFEENGDIKKVQQTGDFEKARFSYEMSPINPNVKPYNEE
ncbi:MAG: family 43 glycosylhydrolase [Marinilabiliaceae bacterium]|nr:family 43 glycosylhydrolase [Marinilabiliaceae bacterium]